MTPHLPSDPIVARVSGILKIAWVRAWWLHPGLQSGLPRRSTNFPASQRMHLPTRVFPSSSFPVTYALSHSDQWQIIPITIAAVRYSLRSYTPCVGVACLIRVYVLPVYRVCSHTVDIWRGVCVLPPYTGVSMIYAVLPGCVRMPRCHIRTALHVSTPPHWRMYAGMHRCTGPLSLYASAYARELVSAHG